MVLPCVPCALGFGTKAAAALVTAIGGVAMIGGGDFQESTQKRKLW